MSTRGPDRLRLHGSKRIEPGAQESGRGADVASAQREPASSRAPGPGPILVVDDDQRTPELLVSILAHAGCAVLAVASAREARLALAAGDTFAVLLSEVRMPGEIGLDLAREVALPRGDWIATWSGEHVRGGGEVFAPAARERIPVWVRSGSIVDTYPAAHVAAGLGDTPESERPLEATLWGEPPLGHAAVRLADGTQISWRRGRWSIDRPRAVVFGER